MMCMPFLNSAVDTLTIPKHLVCGEAQHVADRARAGEEHNQAIEAECYACRRRYPRLQRPDQIVVYIVNRPAERDPLFSLCFQASALLDRVGQLGEGVGELQPAGEELEALGEAGVVGLRPRERGELDRVIVEDG